MKIKLLFVFSLICLLNLAQEGSVPLYAFNVENFPSVYGGKPEWERLLHHHLVYPRMELKNNIEGTVKIKFIVGEDGKTSNTEIKKSVSPAIDKEALRLL